MDFFAASSSRKKTDATSSAPFALSFFFLSVWVLPFFCFVFFVLFLALFFNLLFWKKKKTCAIESKKKERFFRFLRWGGNDFEMRVGMWTPEDAQRLKQGTLLQTPREEEALKKIPPLLKKGPLDLFKRLFPTFR